jgi:ornithine decarboxylase
MDVPVSKLAANYERRAEVTLDFAVVRDAVRRNGDRTPLLLLDPKRIGMTAARLRAAMPRVALHYAVKANPDPHVLAAAQAENLSFEVASIAELQALLALRVPAGDVHFSNPIKPREHVIQAARAGVRWFAIDSVEELGKIVEVAPNAHLCVRIDTQNIGSDWPLTGKFGASPPEVEDILTEACRLEADVAGVSFHVGSQCRNLDNWRIGVQNAKRVFEMMHARGLEPRLLNLGGGFPAQHRKPIPAIEKIGESVNRAIADLPSSMRVMAEPGRYLVSDCAWLVTRVIGTAVRRGTRWIYLDTGIYHGLMEALGGLDYDFRTARQGSQIPCIVAGPTCDATDVVARDKLLPEDLREGDYVYIPNAGAYTVAYGTQFNGFPSPGVVCLSTA